ncbi:enoyl-CoA hydratase-related protein [Paracoccus sp. DMF-8]|uniref:enoyl-CoA hydratase-related protein n=1 Tax=Paracoccus sp. DMF-8 TaxID=3019445 RepID=UPI0023E7BD86|nr:enoyl-CoA hydratase-related protein [Paracoccus sp. DMF-8]MDF3606191.1 enoyl-CoA hydratase-related protein [Paracoccus sp. DMF-8]
MDYQTILFAMQDGVATVTMNRPEVMNALSSTMRAEITHAATALPAGTRCLVLTGAGRAFCSGQDLGDARAAADLEGTLRDEYEPMIHALRNAPVPVIAAVNGVAAGAGANLALVADVVIAARSASFVQAFTRIGLMPDAGGTHVLPRLVGQARAMGAMLFADSITADQAADWGMIWEAVADEEFAAVVAARALALAKGPTRAYLAVREALAASAANDFARQLQVEARLQGELGQSADFTEGVSAFLQKRAAQFTGA